ncbi:MAG: hypothetical protein V1722_02255 [Candidatus Micrarchaeota archaeon]
MNELETFRGQIASKIGAALKKARIANTVSGGSVHVVVDNLPNLTAFAKLPRDQTHGRPVHEIVANLAKKAVSEIVGDSKVGGHVFVDYSETHHVATAEKHPAGFLMPGQRLHAVTLKVLYSHEVPQL